MQPPRFQFEVHPSSGVPIYRQIVAQVQAMAAGGRLMPGAMLPSVRQVAADLQINPMTVSKAYAMLETSGTVERVRGTGMRIAQDGAAATLRQRQSQLRELLDPAVVRARQLQLSDEQILAATNAAMKEHPQ